MRVPPARMRPGHASMRPPAAKSAAFSAAVPRPQEVTQMHDGWFAFEVASGVPVVTAPEEIDITNAPELRSALLEAAARARDARGRHDPDPVL
jgi:hypothetical protein